jgi:phosphoribosyl 1,2-cyclic phosphodiesterase
MRIRFWGVRGSVPWVTPLAIRHGCNTPCIEITDEQSREMLIIDAGSGIVGLGESLGTDECRVPILLSHYHWDHVQGLPFFGPLYRQGSVATVHAPWLDGHDASVARRIFDAPFFPLDLDSLPAPPRIQSLGSASFGIGPFDIATMRLNHPGGALAFRITGRNGTFVYASDHELGRKEIDRELTEFLAGASAAILDAHFTPDEEPAHRGWGHSSWAGAVSLGLDAGVKRLFLFHHKPGRTDDELDEIERQARRRFPDTFVAVEGDTFTV